MSVEAIPDNERLEVGRLVKRAQNGDRGAFGELFERFERTVFTIASRRLRHVDEAEELVQDVFVQAITKLDQLREPERFGGWLRSITHRMAINRLVRRKLMLSSEPELLEARCVDRATPLSLALSGERNLHVRQGMERLRDLDRETLLAFYVNGHSLVEMSDEFNAPLGTIKRRLHVARKRLAKEVEPMAV